MEFCTLAGFSLCSRVVMRFHCPSGDFITLSSSLSEPGLRLRLTLKYPEPMQIGHTQPTLVLYRPALSQHLDTFKGSPLITREAIAPVSKAFLRFQQSLRITGCCFLIKHNGLG